MPGQQPRFHLPLISVNTPEPINYNAGVVRFFFCTFVGGVFFEGPEWRPTSDETESFDAGSCDWIACHIGYACTLARRGNIVLTEEMRDYVLGRCW